MKKTAKKWLAILLTAVMLIGIVPMLDLQLAKAAFTTEGGTPTFKFYVPETIYVKPSDGKSFQYYLNREQTDAGALRTSQDANGMIYFNCPAATSVTSLACTNGADIGLSATTSATGTLKATASNGSLYAALPSGGTTQIEWTIKFKYNGAEHEAYAYSTVYSPNRNVTANGVYGYDGNDWDNACASGIVWIQGAQTTGQATYSDEDNSANGRVVAYQNVSTGSDDKYLDPLVNGVCAPSNNRPSTYSTGTSPFTNATKSFLGCNCVKEDDRDGDGDWVVHIDYNKTSAGIIADTSRYTNLNQIPNLKLGFLITDLANCNQRRNAYLSDATSAVTWSGSTPHLYSSSKRKDLTIHQYWRDDDISKDCYDTAYGSVLWTSGNNPPSTGGDNNPGTGVKYQNGINYALSGGNKTLFYRGCVSGSSKDWNSNSWSISCAMVSLSVTTVNKSSLRSLYNECIGGYLKDYYTSNTWGSYLSALKSAADVLGYPAASASAITSAVNALTNAKNALVKKTGTATLTHKSSTGKVLETETESYNYGETITAAANDYTGYTFNGAVDPDVLSYSDVQTDQYSWTFTYQPVNYTIGYDLDGGTQIVANRQNYNIETDTFTLNAPVKDGFDFAGWTGTDLTEPTMSVTIPQGSTGARSYTATWTRANYTISYELDGGALAGGVTNPTSYNVETPDITLNDPTRTGYEFLGWAGTGAAYATTPLVIPQGSTGNRSYTAMWKANPYTVAFDGNGAESGSTASMSMKYDEVKALTANGFGREGYTFLGWNTDANATAALYTDGQEVSNLTAEKNGEVTLYAIWQINDYALLVNPGAGTWNGSAEAQTFTRNYGTTLEIADPTAPEGYQFKNWTLTGGGTFADGVYTFGAQAGTLTANYEIKKYTITFMIDGTPVNKEFEHNATAAFDGTPEKEQDENYHYIFAGWEPALTTVTGPATYTAQFTTEAHYGGTATCTEDAQCAYCGYLYIAALGHQAGDPAVDEDPATCTEDGLRITIVNCSVCGEQLSYNEVVLPATGHTPDEPIETVTKEPTCTAYGSKDEVVLCADCGTLLETRNSVPIPPKGHTPGENEHEVVREANCVLGGIGRDFVRCTECGAEVSSVLSYTPKLEHTPGEQTVTVVREATCAQTGITKTEVRCTACGEVLSQSKATTEKLAHTPGAPVVTTTPATCTKDGATVTEIRCTECDELISRTSEPIAAAGHTPGAPVVVETAATCTEAGSKVTTVTCTVCGEVISEEREDYGYAHDLIFVPAKNPTETETGNIEYYICRHCGACFKDAAGKQPIDEADTVLPKLGEATGSGICRYCGQTHEGFFGALIWIFHSIAYFFMTIFGLR